jgi:hypothetical protein
VAEDILEADLNTQEEDSLKADIDAANSDGEVTETELDDAVDAVLSLASENDDDAEDLADDLTDDLDLNDNEIDGIADALSGENLSKEELKRLSDILADQSTEGTITDAEAEQSVECAKSDTTSETSFIQIMIML